MRGSFKKEAAMEVDFSQIMMHAPILSHESYIYARRDGTSSTLKLTLRSYTMKMKLHKQKFLQ